MEGEQEQESVWDEAREEEREGEVSRVPMLLIDYQFVKMTRQDSFFP
jgi:hypothetical protein